MSITLRIGTRGSHLARAQTRQMCAALEGAVPGLVCEEVIVSTAGDQDQTSPLWSFGQTSVFAHALDDALLAGRIDAAVHSLKDLGTERPDGIALAAVPMRRNPRDIVLYRADIRARLEAGLPIRLGTSSPRRETLMPPFLTTHLPQWGAAPHIQAALLRGNVPSRVERLHRPAEAAGALDAVPLALAGLARLWDDAEGRAVLEPLLALLPWQVMPAPDIPAAPGQGALAICVRRDDAKTAALIREALHHPDTAKAVDIERAILRAHGGGCHQRFGVAHLAHPHLPDGLTFTRGETTKGIHLDEQRGAPGELEEPVWDGRQWRAETVRTVAMEAPPPQAEALFVAHHRGWVEGSHAAHVWTSGTMSWRKLAERGVWVNGCAEALGFAHIQPTLEEPVLRMPPLRDWVALTHKGALENWTAMPAIATYGLETQPSDAAIMALQNAHTAYWASTAQFEAMRPHMPAGLTHACGPGKTYTALQEAGLSPTIALMPPRDIQHG